MTRDGNLWRLYQVNFDSKKVYGVCTEYCTYKTLHFYSISPPPFGHIFNLLSTCCHKPNKRSLVTLAGTEVCTDTDAWVGGSFKDPKEQQKKTANIHKIILWWRIPWGFFVDVHQWRFLLISNMRDHRTWLEVKRMLKSDTVNYIFTCAKLGRCPPIEPHGLRPHSLLLFLSTLVTIQTATVTLYTLGFALTSSSGLLESLNSIAPFLIFKVQFSHFFTSL